MQGILLQVQDYHHVTCVLLEHIVYQWNVLHVPQENTLEMPARLVSHAAQEPFQMLLQYQSVNCVKVGFIVVKVQR